MTTSVNNILLYTGENPSQLCGICRLPVNQQNRHLGPAIIHQIGSHDTNGAKHSFHFTCFIQAILLSPTTTCPMCKILIPIDTSIQQILPRREPLSERLRSSRTFIVVATGVHALTASLIGSPLITSALPGILAIPFTAHSLYTASKDIGISNVMKESIRDVLMHVCAIALPMITSFVASSITTSTLPNSFLTVTLLQSTILLLIYLIEKTIAGGLYRYAIKRIDTVGKLINFEISQLRLS